MASLIRFMKFSHAQIPLSIIIACNSWQSANLIIKQINDTRLDSCKSIGQTVPDKPTMGSDLTNVPSEA